jgi:hypothetical protein
MGWYLLSENTTLSEMEWMLARAAGYSAGFAMVANADALKKNPHTPELLDAIREWETARNGSAFSKEQQESLKKPENEFHLEKTGNLTWSLSSYAASALFVREKIVRQPGEPATTVWNYNQEWKSQAMQFRLSVNGTAGTVSNIKMQIDNYTEIIIPAPLNAGETLFCDGTETLRIYDKNGKLKSTQVLTSIPPVVAAGYHSVIIDCAFGGEDPPKIEMQFKGISKTETCIARK